MAREAFPPRQLRPRRLIKPDQTAIFAQLTGATIDWLRRLVTRFSETGPQMSGPFKIREMGATLGQEAVGSQSSYLFHSLNSFDSTCHP